MTTPPLRYPNGHLKRLKSRELIEQPMDISIKYIPLTKGKFCIVDSDMYDTLISWNWSVHGKIHKYAMRGEQCDGVKTRHIYMHRFILGLHHGDLRHGDHINGNTFDNRRVNLRIVTKQQNCQNRKTPATNTSGFRGVYWDSRCKRWGAKLQISGKVHYSGFYLTKEEAIESRINAEKLHYGEYACLSK